MTRYKFVAGLTVFCTCLVASACSVLSPQPDRARFFILTPISAADSTAIAPSAAAAASQLVVGVGPIKFPQYLQRRQVVRRASPNRIEVSENGWWAEPLDANFTQVLSENLSRLLLTPTVMTYPWYGATPIDYQVEVQVMRFDTTTEGLSQLNAQWSIREGFGGKVLYATSSTFTAPAASGDIGMSAALSHDLAELSRAIASRIADLNEMRRRRAREAARARVTPGGDPRATGRHLLTATP